MVAVILKYTNLPISRYMLFPRRLTAAENIDMKYVYIYCEVHRNLGNTPTIFL